MGKGEALWRVFELRVKDVISVLVTQAETRVGSSGAPVWCAILYECELLWYRGKWVFVSKSRRLLTVLVCCSCYD